MLVAAGDRDAVMLAEDVTHQLRADALVLQLLRHDADSKGRRLRIASGSFATWRFGERSGMLVKSLASHDPFVVVALCSLVTLLVAVHNDNTLLVVL